jgi:hypothetical protein
LQTQIFKKQLENTAKNNRTGEQNQTFIQLMVHPDKSLTKWYCDMNPHWEAAVRKWLLDRDEPEFAELMVKKIKGAIKTP